MARDLLQIRRGLEEDLPALSQGEQAITLDTERYFVGGTSGVIEFQSTKYTTFVNVKSPKFPLVGLKGNGVTDDSVALQNLVDYYENEKVTFFFPKGIYLLNNSITDLSNAHNYVCNKYEVELLNNTTDKYTFVISDDITQRAGYKFENLTFTFNQVQTAGGAINLQFVGDCKIVNCRFYNDNKGYMGVHVKRGTNIEFENVQFDNTISNSIYVYGTGTGDNRSVDVFIKYCRIIGGNNPVIIGDFCEAFIVDSFECYGFTGTAITISPLNASTGLYNFFLSRLNIEGNNGKTFYASNVDNINISDSWLQNAVGSVIELTDTVTTVQISNTQIDCNHANPAVKTNAKAVIIDSCIIQSSSVNSTFGVQVQALSDNVIISNNIIRQLVDSGVDIVNGATLVNIVGNNFRNISSNVDVTGISGDRDRTVYLHGNTTQVSRNINSASTMTFREGKELFSVIGNVSINTITPSFPGKRLTLIFEGSLTVNDSTGNLRLNGNYVTTPYLSVLSLICDGVDWFETSRSTN